MLNPRDDGARALFLLLQRKQTASLNILLQLKESKTLLENSCRLSGYSDLNLILCWLQTDKHIKK